MSPAALDRAGALMRTLSNAQVARDTINRLLPLAVGVVVGGNKVVKTLVEIDSALHKLIEGAKPDANEQILVRLEELQAEMKLALTPVTELSQPELAVERDTIVTDEEA